MTEMTVPNTTSSARFDEEGLAGFLKENGRRIGIGAAVLVVIVAAIWMVQSSARRKEAFASQELLQARAAAEAGNLPLASSALTRIIERFGGTKAADEAAIVLNQVRLLQGQRDVAINALQQFVRERHPDYILASAYNLLAGGLEDQGKPKDAADSYRLASDHAVLDFEKAQYLIDAGRAYVLAGDTASARRAYGDVLEKYPLLDQAAEARVRQGEIGGTVPAMPKDTSTAR